MEDHCERDHGYVDTQEGWSREYRGRAYGMRMLLKRCGGHGGKGLGYDNALKRGARDENIFGKMWDKFVLILFIRFSTLLLWCVCVLVLYTEYNGHLHPALRVDQVSIF